MPHPHSKPDEADEDLDLVLPEQGSSLGSLKGAKEGQELTVPREHYPAASKGQVLLLGQQPQEQDEDEEDMGTIKRRAQVRQRQGGAGAGTTAAFLPCAQGFPL